MSDQCLTFFLIIIRLINELCAGRCPGEREKEKEKEKEKERERESTIFLRSVVKMVLLMKNKTSSLDDLYIFFVRCAE